jgi:hypothetical protein
MREKGPHAKDIHKEMFPVYGGKCLERKAVHICVANVSLMTKRLKRRCGSGETTGRRLLFRGFDSLVKRWDKCISVCGGYVEN